MNIKKAKIQILTVIFSLLLIQNNFADNVAHTFNLCPSAGGYLFEGNQDIDDNFTAGISLGFNFSHHWGLEGLYNFVDTDYEKKTGDVDAHVFRADLSYHFQPEDRLVPYLAMGGGAIQYQHEPYEDRADPFFDYGVGLKYFFSRTFAIRLDVRHIIPFGDDDDPTRKEENDYHHNFLGQFGFHWQFGGSKREITKDSDRDGVIDKLDKCPDTPKGIRVDLEGCPLDSDEDGVPDHKDKSPGTPRGIKVDDKGRPYDSDGDGVLDPFDKCPDTPPGIDVNFFGCPLDADKDGVPDYKDRCPNTPKGTNVDARGCAVDSDQDGVPDYLDESPGTPFGVPVDARGSMVIKGLYFEPGKTTIKPESHAALNEVIRLLRKYPDWRVEIRGHTDDTGDDKQNLMLSMSRALAVKHYLTGKGILGFRLIPQGLGASKPLASNKTLAGRAQNRRVEIQPVP
ncbi:OmpA family protein [Candidatus Riflebacteria bacterium]